MNRTLDQYAKCDPFQVVSGSHAQALHFAKDATADIAELAARIAALEAENAKLRAALIEASTRMKNARSAVESNQVIDKDVHGTLTRGMFEIAEALGE
jgi:uncharacterized small protein (DUF1192 family)